MYVAIVALIVQATATQDTLRPPTALDGRTLSAVSPHRYLVSLKAGDFLRGVVEQHRLDVVVTIRDPAANVGLEVDSPNGTDGPEPISFIATTTGVYVLDVKAFDANGSGTYDLRLEAIRPATERDRQLIAAGNQLADASRLRTEALAALDRARFDQSAPLYAQALTLAEQALAARERHLGPDHPEVVPVLSLLGYIEDERGDYVPGERRFTRALSILERQFGVGHAATLTVQNDLGYLRMNAGDLRGAVAVFSAGLVVRERLFGPTGPRIVVPLAGLGEALFQLDQRDSAEIVFRRLLVVRAATSPGDEAALVSTGVWLGRTLVKKGRLAEADSLCARARAVSEPRRDRSPSAFAAALTCIAESAIRAGNGAVARDAAAEAARLREAAFGPIGPPTAEALTLLGRALASAGDMAGARTTLQRALDIQQRRLPASHPSTEHTRRALADLGQRPPTKTDDSIVLDQRDGRSYRTVRIGTQRWMSQNMRFVTPASRCYDDREENCARLGRLYTWRDAVAACPPGWRLASDGDWQELERAIGMPPAELAGTDARGPGTGERLKLGGDLRFNVELGGWLDPQAGRFRRIDTSSALWTSTQSGPAYAWHRDVGQLRTAIWRSPVPEGFGLSARCVEVR